MQKFNSKQKYISTQSGLFWAALFLIDFVFLGLIYAALPNTRALNKAEAIERVNTLPNFKPVVIRPNSRNYVPYRRIPKALRYSVILLEDGKFFDHRGFDFEEMGKAVLNYLKHGKRLRGASTISQQLVKNLYLSNERSWRRKFLEALITIKLEAHVPKEKILELYFNGIDWGRGLIGIKNATNHYFRIVPDSLTIKQAVFLASIIPNPARFSRNPNSIFVRTRMMMALEALYRSRIIDLDEYSYAVTDPL